MWETWVQSLGWEDPLEEGWAEVREAVDQPTMHRTAFLHQGPGLTPGWGTKIPQIIQRVEENLALSSTHVAAVPVTLYSKCLFIPTTAQTLLGHEDGLR